MTLSNECKVYQRNDKDEFYRNCVVFWDVDTQNDFMLSKKPGGRLYVEGAEDIIPTIQKITDFANIHEIPILGSMDLHKKSDPELKPQGIFDKHCMAIPGTRLPSKGAKPIPESLGGRELHMIKSPKSFDKYYTECIEEEDKLCSGLVVKDSYNVFDQDEVMEHAIKKIKGKLLVMYGVATDYCLGAAAEDFLDVPIDTIIITDAIEGVDKDASKTRLRNLKEEDGAILVKFDELDNKLFSIG